MYMFSVFGSGFYSFILWPIHIPLWCTGYLIQDKVKSPTARGIWLGIWAVGLLLCEMLCQWVLTGYDRLGAAIVMLVIWDLVFGYFAIYVGKTLSKGFRMLVDWINKDEED